MGYCRTIIDIADPPRDAKPRRVWSGKQRLPREVLDWLAVHPYVAPIAYVVRVTDRPRWLVEACLMDGRRPGALGCYVIWHREPSSAELDVTAACRRILSRHRDEPEDLPEAA